MVIGRPLPPFIPNDPYPRARRTPSRPSTVPFDSPVFTPTSSSPLPSRQPSPTMAASQHQLQPRRSPSPPVNRRSPSGRVPFDSPSFTPLSSSPPPARQPSPPMPASRRQEGQRHRLRRNRSADNTADSHQRQLQATPSSTSSQRSVLSLFLPSPSPPPPAQSLLPIARRPCSNSIRTLSFGRMDAVCRFCSAKHWLAERLLAGQPLQHSLIVAIMARSLSTHYRHRPYPSVRFLQIKLLFIRLWFRVSPQLERSFLLTTTTRRSTTRGPSIAYLNVLRGRRHQ
jgi:hypothetical protein